jgi:thioredoxin reductase
MAKLNSPHPPGNYPVVIVGSGPGGLQLSYSLSRLGVSHALISQDGAPGGMFRRFPILQRLISWTKPYAPVPRGTRAYERFDWNSLIGDEPHHRSLAPEVMDGSSYFPSRAEMEKGIALFAGRAGIAVRYGCTWESTRREDGGFVLTTSDGEYRCAVAVFAVGMAEPWKPPIPGLEHVPHYAQARPPAEYAGKRVFIIGKANSGFELADGLLPWAGKIILASPHPARISVITRSLVGARARYLQPYEDHVLAGGNVIMDLALERVERTADGYRVHAAGTTVPGRRVLDVDHVIAATGFEVPMLDLRALGVVTILQNRLPAQTPFWESASVPGVYFAGTASQGATELRKHGIPSSSAAVHGFRYNAIVLARHIAEKHLGVALERPQVRRQEVVDYLLSEATEAPELWSQRSYLARALEFDPARGPVDAGIVPLAHFVDSGGMDAVAITVESDAEGLTYPAVYVRSRGDVEEFLLPPSDGHDYRTPEHRGLITEGLRGVLET